MNAAGNQTNQTFSTIRMEARIGPGHKIPYLDLQFPGTHFFESTVRDWLKDPDIYPGKSSQDSAFFWQGFGSAIQYDGDDIYLVVNGHPESTFLKRAQAPSGVTCPFRKDQHRAPHCQHFTGFLHQPSQAVFLPPFNLQVIIQPQITPIIGLPS